tara:strand:+ start:165 stop:743 length:579 start_codon:yes stop_codon:yes gene_type:complete
MKIFFLGGTFDPPHIGHAKIVEKCINKCDKFILIPTMKSPHKKHNPLANSFHRLNMLKLIFNDNEKIFIDDFEITSNLKNYTYITVEYLKSKYKDAELTMILGYDQLLNFKNWKESNQILKSVNIMCFNRELENKIVPKAFNFNKINFVENFNQKVSSSLLRERFANNLVYSSEFLDDRVNHYILKNKLYAN